MPRRYPKEVADFIAEHIEGTHFSDLAELVNEAFGLNLTSKTLRSYAKNHGLKNGCPRRPVGTYSKTFPKEIAEFIAQNVEGRTAQQLADLVNETFGTSYKESQIKGFRSNHGLRCGVDCKFKPGQPSHNKGQKGLRFPGSEKGWFKKGNTPHNHVEIGTEVMRTDGYLQTKIGEPNVWKLTHILVWEQHNGPLPEGMSLLFLDGDHQNTNIENLMPISRAELARLNQNHLARSDADLTKSGVLVARLMTQIGKAKKRRQPK